MADKPQYVVMREELERKKPHRNRKEPRYHLHIDHNQYGTYEINRIHALAQKHKLRHLGVWPGHFHFFTRNQGDAYAFATEMRLTMRLLVKIDKRVKK